MRNNTLGVLALFAAGYLLLGNKIELPDIHIPDLGGGGTVVPANPTPAPPDDLKAAVQPVADLVKLANAKDRADLAGLYKAMGQTVAANPEVYTTANAVRALITDAGPIFVRVTGKSQDTVAPGLAKAIDAAFAQVLGLDAPLDAQRRQRVVDTFNAVVWACEQ